MRKISHDPVPTQSSVDLINQIDDVLPQTQCGQCGFSEGCQPYAQAMVLLEEPANLCVPGGQPLADQLAQLLNREPLPCAPSHWPIDNQTMRPVEVQAVIDESLCIGCFKCVTACPVDAIVGAAKLMHTVISSECTGCELFLEPCPVDCIDLVAVGTTKLSQPAERTRFKDRYQRHSARLKEQTLTQSAAAPIVSAKQTQLIKASTPSLDADSAKQRIEAAKLRTQMTKLEKRIKRITKSDQHAHEALDELKREKDQLSLQLGKLTNPTQNP